MTSYQCIASFPDRICVSVLKHVFDKKIIIKSSVFTFVYIINDMLQYYILIHPLSYNIINDVLNCLILKYFLFIRHLYNI